jgi:hypothetical protein
MEGRRVSRLVASAMRPHPALAVHLARGQVGQGVGPVLDTSCQFTELLTTVTFFISSVAFLHQGMDRPPGRRKRNFFGPLQSSPHEPLNQ